jgi:hypothetical protein
MGVGLRGTLVATGLSGNRTTLFARQLMPADRARHAHPKPCRSTAAAHTAINCRDHTITQILRECFGHPCRPPSPSLILNQNSRADGIPADSAAVENALLETCARVGVDIGIDC